MNPQTTSRDERSAISDPIKRAMHDAIREMWIEEYGSAKGFSAWFAKWANKRTGESPSSGSAASR